MIRVGLSRFFGNVPFALVEDQYRGEGFELVFGDDFRRERLLEGEYQIAAFTLNALLMSLGDLPRVARACYAYVRAAGNGSDLIVCRGLVRDTKQLARVRIGVQRGSLEHFLFEYLFRVKASGCKANYIWMPRSGYGTAMREGHIDAAVFCDPALSQILSHREFQLFEGNVTQIARTAIGAVVVRRELLVHQRDRVGRFLTILQEALVRLEEAHDQELRVAAPEFFAGIARPRETLRARVVFLTLEDNRRLFSREEADSLFRQCSEWAEVIHGIAGDGRGGPEIEEVLDGSVIQSLGPGINAH